MLWQRLSNMNEDLKNYPFINTGASIPISTYKLRMNHSYIVSGISIPSCSQYSRNDQWFKADIESPSLLEKDVELFYCLVAKLLFIRKIARLDIQACIACIFTTMELPMNYYKNRHLDIDILFVNKTQMFLMLPLNNRCMYFKTLFSKHNKYILNKLQQIIQSQRLKNVFTVVEGFFKNIVDWIHSNLQKDLIKYITDSQPHTSKDIIPVTNKLMKREVKSDSV